MIAGNHSQPLPLPNQTSSEFILRLLINRIICHHGIFMSCCQTEKLICYQVYVLTDRNGKGFAHAQSDGLVENFNRTLRAMFAKHHQSLGCNWVVYLQ